jgi:hypothetical protein
MALLNKGRQLYHPEMVKQLANVLSAAWIIHTCPSVAFNTECKTQHTAYERRTGIQYDIFVFSELTI